MEKNKNNKCRKSSHKWWNKKSYIYNKRKTSNVTGLLKNNIAIQVSINIMKAFVEIRKFISSNAKVFERLTNVEYKLLEHDKKFDEVLR